MSAVRRIAAAGYGWIGRAFTLTEVEPWKVYAKNVGAASSGGRLVTVEGALALTVIFCCMRLWGDLFATLPLDVLRRDGKSKRLVEDDEHVVARMFRDEPNQFMTPQQYIKNMQLAFEGWGNAFSEIQRGARGDPVGLLPLHPAGMSLAYDPGAIWPKGYWQNDGKSGRRFLPSSEVLHLRGLGGGLWGLSPIAAARLAVGGALAAEDYGARLYRNGLRRAGYLSIDQVLKPEQRVQIQENIIAKMADPDTLIVSLEAGFKFEPTSLSQEDAQYIETRKWQAIDLARLFNIPPHMVGELDSSAHNNVEDQGIDFVRIPVAGRAREWEGEIRRKLFTPREKSADGYYVKMQLDALMRGASAARANFYNTMTRAGIMSRNECRELEDLEPREGGDELLVQAQMQPAADAAPPAAPPGRGKQMPRENMP